MPAALAAEALPLIAEAVASVATMVTCGRFPGPDPPSLSAMVTVAAVRRGKSGKALFGRFPPAA